MRRCAIVLAGALAGCQWIPGTDAHRIEEGQELVRQGLVDPESAQFRQLKYYPAGNIVCGEVNAKNRMGGYAGFKQFYALKDEAAVAPDASATPRDDLEAVTEQARFAGLWSDFCSGVPSQLKPDPKTMR